MVNLQIIAVGKLKEKWLSDGCAEYQKRMGAYCRVQLLELEESRLPQEPSPAQIEAALRAEGVRILEKAKGGRLIALGIEGKHLSAEELSHMLSHCAVEGINTVSFVIGSSFGLSEKVKRAAALRLSMSEMTFPHQLARLMLCEQLYRACMIESGGRYHK